MQRQQEATANPIQKPEKRRDSNHIARCKNAQEKHNANHHKEKLQKVMKKALAILGTAPRKGDARKKDCLMQTRKTHIASNANQMSRAKRRPMEECTAREQQESNRCKEEKQHDAMTEQAACKMGAELHSSKRQHKKLTKCKHMGTRPPAGSGSLRLWKKMRSEVCEQAKSVATASKQSKRNTSRRQTMKKDMPVALCIEGKLQSAKQARCFEMSKDKSNSCSRKMESVHKTDQQDKHMKKHTRRAVHAHVSREASFVHRIAGLSHLLCVSVGESRNVALCDDKQAMRS